MPELYEFQKQAVEGLTGDHHICILPTGAGKTAVMFKWLQGTGKKRIVVVTTATKARSGDMEQEALTWCGEKWLNGLTEFEVISWHKLKKWVLAHLSERCSGFAGYAFAFDEVQKCKGYSTAMGKFFRVITNGNKSWTGYTATPGDKWEDLMTYYVATGKSKHKTAWMNRYAMVQTFKGYPEIVGYNNEQELSDVWKEITVIPDASQMFRELPKETHKTIKVKAPSDYKQIMKTRLNREGELIDTTMGLCHYLRQICFTDEKREWLSDFIEGLGTNCVFFCNYIEEEEVVCEIAKKVLPKKAKIWRIDGKHHEIPAINTIGKYDIVVAHYASGGEALNLQFMNYWCAVSPNYSFSKSVQARGRIKRIGQKKPMFFYYLKAEGTIEDDIYECLKNKSDFSEKVWCANIDKSGKEE